jgi:hypothetical protein
MGMSRLGGRAISVAAALLLVTLGAARAQDAGDESPFHALARVFGLAAGPQAPADFVKESRPDAPADTIPAFSDPKEPSSSVLSPASLKAMDAELDAAVKVHKKLRAAEGLPDDATQPKAAAKPDAKKKKDATSAKN